MENKSFVSWEIHHFYVTIVDVSCQLLLMPYLRNLILVQLIKRENCLISHNLKKKKKEIMFIIITFKRLEDQLTLP